MKRRRESSLRGRRKKGKGRGKREREKERERLLYEPMFLHNAYQFSSNAITLTVNQVSLRSPCRKTLHSRTKAIRLVIQIQKALWRKLEPLFSRNKKALRFKRGQRNCACIRGQILPTRKQ